MPGDFVALKSFANVFWEVARSDAHTMKLTTLDKQVHGLGTQAGWKAANSESSHLLVATRGEDISVLKDGAHAWFGDWSASSTTPNADPTGGKPKADPPGSKPIADPHQSWKEVAGAVVSADELADFYQKHDPSKLDSAGEYAERYMADPEFLVNTLRKKYGESPVPTLWGQKDLYKVLGIQRAANPTQVTQAYQNRLQRSVRTPCAVKPLSPWIHTHYYSRPCILAPCILAPCMLAPCIMPLYSRPMYARPLVLSRFKNSAENTSNDPIDQLAARVGKFNIRAVEGAFAILGTSEKKRRWDAENPDPYDVDAMNAHVRACTVNGGMYC
jgi:hypothetical protein